MLIEPFIPLHKQAEAGIGLPSELDIDSSLTTIVTGFTDPIRKN